MWNGSQRCGSGRTNKPLGGLFRRHYYTWGWVNSQSSFAFRPQEKGRGPGTLPNLFYVCLLELLLLIFLVLLLLVLLVLGLVVALIVLGLIVLGAVLIAILLVVAHKTHLFSRP